MALNSLNRDQTLNRLNGLPVNQRGVHEEISANNFNAYNGSPIAAEFDHRHDSGAQDLDSDVKSFYSTQQFYTQSLNTVENVMEFCNDNLKGPAKTEFIVKYDEDEGIRLSDHGSDRDSESGMLQFCYFCITNLGNHTFLKFYPNCLYCVITKPLLRYANVLVRLC